MSNVDLHKFYSQPKTSLSEVPFRAFGQENEAYSQSTMLRNSAMQKLNELKTRKQEQKPYDATGKTTEQIFAETGQQSTLDKFGGADKFHEVMASRPMESMQNFYQSSVDKMGDVYGQVEESMSAMGRAAQNKILGGKGMITQRFGNRSGVEKYSGGVNYGTDIAVPKGTPVAAPYGEWEVVEAFDQAGKEGPNNAQGGINRGYGNSVLIQNTKTGEKLRYSHLRVGGVGVKAGQTLSGGTVLGETGATGNTAGRTGQHLDLEYYNPQGKISNVEQTPYWRSLM